MADEKQDQKEAALNALDGAIVYLGNSAPTHSELQPATKEEAEAAGPLGRVQADAKGKREYAVLSQSASPTVKESYTSFSFPGALREAEYTLTKWLADIRLAFTRQHSSEPPSWAWSNNPAVGHIVGMEFSTGNHNVEVIPSDQEPPLQVTFHDGTVQDHRPSAIAKGAQAESSDEEKGGN